MGDNLSWRQKRRQESAGLDDILTARGLDHRARSEYPDRRMEQGMGYFATIGMVLMDELARVCERNEERFTGVRTNLSKVEEELGKAHDWSSQVQDQVTALETNI